MKRHWFLWLFVSNIALADNLLTLHIHKSPAGYDWSTPATLTKDSLKNTVLGWFGKYKHPLGHVSLRLNCPELKIDQYIGMARLNFAESRNLLLFDGAGLGSLLHNFQGRLERKEDIEPDVEHNAMNGEVLLVSYKISEKACKNTQQFLEQYIAGEFWRNYGLPNRPLKGQGSGCSAFATSILQVAGIDFTNFDRHWSDHVFIPKALIGPHNSEIYKKGEVEKKIVTNNVSKVPFWSLLDSSHKWEQNSDSIVIKYYSPDKMFAWATSVAENPETSPELPVILKKYKNTFHLIYDYTNRYQHYELEGITHDKKNI
jgi:hypothetical protein